MRKIIAGIAALVIILASCATKPKADSGPSPGQDTSSSQNASSSASTMDAPRQPEPKEAAWSIEEARKTAAGIYKGTMPYPGSDGLETVVRLRKDGSFILRTRVKGRIDDSIVVSGEFDIDRAGLVSFNKESSATVSRFYSFNKEAETLTQLDKEAKLIATDTPARYVLKKFPAEIFDTYWKLVRLYGKPVVWTGDIKREPRLILQLEGRRAIGHSGTNNFNGAYQVKEGGKISFSPMASTMIASPFMQIEIELYRALREGDSYTVDEETFTLGKKGQEPMAVFEAR